MEGTKKNITTVHKNPENTSEQTVFFYFFLMVHKVRVVSGDVSTCEIGTTNFPFSFGTSFIFLLMVHTHRPGGP